MIYSYIVHLPSSAPLKFCRVISVGGDLFPPLKVLASILHVGVGPVDVDVGIRFASLSRVLCLRKRQREKGTEDLPKSATIVTISAVYRTYQRKFVSSPSRSAATTATEFVTILPVNKRDEKSQEAVRRREKKRDVIINSVPQRNSRPPIQIVTNYFPQALLD